MSIHLKYLPISAINFQTCLKTKCSNQVTWEGLQQTYLKIIFLN